jgi:hypothetical protein
MLSQREPISRGQNPCDSDVRGKISLFPETLFGDAVQLCLRRVCRKTLAILGEATIKSEKSLSK